MDSPYIRLYLERFSSEPWIVLLDIAIVTLVIYFALSQLRGTRAEQVLRGIALFILLLIIINLLPGLTAVRWLIDGGLPALFVAVPVIFQDELRRFFAQIGEANFLQRNRGADESDAVIDAVVEASRRLSTRKHGALLVLEQRVGLQNYVETGVPLSAAVTPELLLSIFHKDAELHDGAVIVSKQKVAAASCVMPLSNSRIDDRQLGLRHRAALGTSEESDAVVVIVSEETGQIAIAHKGKIYPRQPQQKLGATLRGYLGQERDG